MIISVKALIYRKIEKHEERIIPWEHTEKLLMSCLAMTLNKYRISLSLKDGSFFTILQKLELAEYGARRKLLSIGLIDNKHENIGGIRENGLAITFKRWTEEDYQKI